MELSKIEELTAEIPVEQRRAILKLIDLILDLRGYRCYNDSIKIVFLAIHSKQEI